MKDNKVYVLQMLCSLENGGAQAMIANLYRAFDKEKFHFDFVIDHKNHNNEMISIVEKLGCKVFFVEQFTGFNRKSVISSWKSFFLNNTHYDILHIHGCSYSSLFIPIAKQNGLKVIMHSHSVTNGKGFKGLVLNLYQFPIRYQADYFFACSKKAGDWAFGKRITKSNRFIIVKNAIDIQSYRYNQRVREDYRKEYGVTNKIIFIHVGRFHESKNHVFILKLFSKIHESNPNTVLWLVGDGKLKNRMQITANKLGLNGKAVFFGSRNDVSNLYQAADCFLFPSKYESLGIVAIEAQVSGLKCFCSNRVPNEVSATTNCVFLPLSINCWKRNIEQTDFCSKRIDCSRKVSAAGYDVSESYKLVAEFYANILRKA